jgi:hypothetical protein
MEKLAFAGPWVGEFGWELFNWQGYLRKLSKNYEKMIVACRTGNNFLYSDFAETISIDNIGYNCDCAINLEFNPNTITLDNAPHDRLIPPIRVIEIKEQEFIQFGNKNTNIVYDIVFHIRKTNKFNTGYRNWENKNWNKLISLLPDGLKYACIGTIEGAGDPPSSIVDDCRGINLESLADMIASSRVVVGPSSGPIHFASLCGTPHVVWSNHSKNRYRYTKEWNPLNTECRYIDMTEGRTTEDRDWDVDPKIVTEKIMELL